MNSVLSSGDMGGVLLLKDCLEAPGGFLLLQALKLALARSYRVVLLSMAHGAHHYQQVLRKLGIGMAAALDGGQLVLLDALHSLAQQETAQAFGGFNLRGICNQVAAIAAAATPPQPVCLIVDDLSLLAAMAGDFHELGAFLHYCCHPGPAVAQFGYCFVALAHWDVEEDERWLARLEHAAQTVVDIEPLESGQSSDVTGRLEVRRRQAAAAAGGAEDGGGGDDVPGVGELGSRAFYYRLADGGVTYFAQGS